MNTLCAIIFLVALGGMALYYFYHLVLAIRERKRKDKPFEKEKKEQCGKATGGSGG